MPIDYNGARQKVNESNQIAIKIVDILAILERGTLIDTPLDSVTLTAAQTSGLKANLGSMGNDLKTVAGQIKDMVKE